MEKVKIIITHCKTCLVRTEHERGKDGWVCTVCGKLNVIVGLYRWRK